MKYVDVYKRKVNVGDTVLCLYHHYQGESSMNKVLNGTLIVVGSETKENYPAIENDKVYCYKIEDSEVQQQAIGFNPQEWFERYNASGVDFSGSYEGIAYNELLDMLGRQVKIGDFVLYDFKKTKANYGLVMSKNKILTETGATKKLNYGLILNNLTKKEEECKKKLVEIYNQGVKLKASTRKVVGTNYTPGEVYLTTDGKYMVTYLGPCGYTVEYKGVGSTTSCANYENLFIKMPVSVKVAKKIKEDVLDSGKTNVKLSDIIASMTLNDRYDGKVFAAWDPALTRKCVTLGDYIPFSKKGESWQSWESHWGIDPRTRKSFYLPSIYYQVFIGEYVASKFKWHKAVTFKKGTLILGSIILDKNVVIMDNDKVKVTLNVSAGV